MRVVRKVVSKGKEEKENKIKINTENGKITLTGARTKPMTDTQTKLHSVSGTDRDR